MILVTGAAGKTGRAVIASLVARGQLVRGLVRREEQIKSLEAVGAMESIAGDVEDQGTLAQAVEGAKTVYHICPNMHPREAIIGERIIHAAQSATVEHFVYHSVLHPQVEAMPHHWQKLRVEEMLFASGLTYTILQPAAYMQNVLANWERIVAYGEYAVPYGLDTCLSMIDLHDLAEVAAVVLTTPGYEGAIFELCATGIHSQSEIAEILGRHLGREVRGVSIPLDRWEQQARSADLGEYALETLLKMFRYYDEYGFRGNGSVLSWLLGRQPTSFEQFLQRINPD